MISAGAGGGGSVGYHRVSDFMKDYESPYTKQVVDAALADFDFGAGQTRAQQDLSLAGNQAFGGSGAALTRSMTEDALTRGRASTSANLRDQGFSRAAELGGKDAASFTAADATNANLAEARASRQIAAGGQLAGLTSQELGQQLSLGEYLRQVESERLQAPISLLGTQAGLTSQLPYNLFNGQTSTQKTSGGTLGAIGSGLLGAASLFAAPMTGGLSLGGLGGLFSGATAAAGIGSKLLSGGKAEGFKF